MRRFFSFEFVCAFVIFASFAHAQQYDFAAGGSTLWSSKNNNASEAFLPPTERGGTYPGLSFQYLNERNRGILLEGAFRYHDAIYNNYQLYRPMFFDANLVYSRRLAAKTHGDFMGGAGMESLLFYAHGSCIGNNGCRAYVNSNHFALHAGFGVRYYAWRNVFIRPEVHYNFVPNNFEFHSDNVFRLGAMVGYTFGTH